MFRGAEAVGQQLCEGQSLEIAVLSHKVDCEVIGAELPHHLAADTAGWKTAGNDTVLTAADGNGYEIPMSIIDRLEKCSALGTVCGAIGCIFNIAALVYSTVGTQQSSAYLVAGIGHIGVLHSPQCRLPVRAADS